ncbi:MAG: AIPR family protein [Desulfobaccales bacterium]
MSNLSTFSMLKEKVYKYQEDYSLDSTTMAFNYICLETILNLNSDEIEDAITDGSSDGGIDALHIIDREVNIFNFKYTDIFENSRNNFPANEIDKILVTMNGIYEKTIINDDVNDLLWEKITEIWDLFEKGQLFFKYYLCSNKQKPTDNAKRKFETHLLRYRFVEFHYIDLEDLVSKILEKKYKKINGDVRFVEKQYFDRSDGPLKGIVATVAATDLINLVKDPEFPGKINENVFNENIRIYLKLDNRINRGIYDTALSDENYEFWYLNNGITIVCEECTYTPNTRSPLVRLNNLQIVNGGQTTHALFEAYLRNPDKIDNILVIVRICETKNYRISEKISETTNSQTPIKTRDLHSNDRIQKKLEDEFKSLGYYYERKKNQFIEYPKVKRLDSELLGQLYMTYYLDMASQAKNNKSLIFSEEYDNIFNENIITASSMLIPYKIYLPLDEMKRDIQRKKRKKEKISERDAFISRATFHLLNSVRIIAEKENLNLDEEKDINKAIELAIKYVNDVVEFQSHKRGDLYTHDKFFKEIKTNKTISDYISGLYPTN